jgi:hypothetical protein
VIAASINVGIGVRTTDADRRSFTTFTSQNGSQLTRPFDLVRAITDASPETAAMPSQLLSLKMMADRFYP